MPQENNGPTDVRPQTLLAEICETELLKMEKMPFGIYVVFESVKVLQAKLELMACDGQFSPSKRLTCGFLQRPELPER